MSVTISANLVKDLREKTGAGMMECKKALQTAEGDMEKAVKILRESGAAKAAKRESRTAAEGLLDIALNDDATAGATAELNCETDFVARNEEFQSVVKALAALALDTRAESFDAMSSKPLPGFVKPAAEIVGDIRAKIGEKIEVNRVAFVEGDFVTGYLHPPGKIAVLLAATLNGASKTPELIDTLRGIAMHIAALGPRFLTESEVDAATLDAERDIFANIARKEGKPENLIAKIVEGRIKTFYKENCLLSQVYVRDGKLSVGQILEAAGKQAGGSVSIARFVRLQVGESAGAPAEE